jgi:hypothetical protein
MRFNAFVLVEVCTAKDVKSILVHSVEGQAFSTQMIGDKGAER